MKPDILQFPLNIVDDRINKTELKKLKRKKILLHARSVFLQGLLLQNQEDLSKKFEKFKNVWQEYDSRFFSSSSNKLETCFGEVLSNNYISYEHTLIKFKVFKPYSASNVEILNNEEF